MFFLKYNHWVLEMPDKEIGKSFFQIEKNI